MKFSIGYQLPDELDSTFAICRDYAGRVSDVYFAWGAEPSGRSPLCNGAEVADCEAVQLDELRRIRALGVSLTLLLNANCYGDEAVSAALRARSLALVRRLRDEAGLANVTTTSPFLTRSIRQEFAGEVRVRASVNMRVGETAALRQLAASFDGFYARKELSRDLPALGRLSDWCAANGKSLHLLANSGCLAHCGFQTFHDNLVAHERGVAARENVPSGFPAPCWEYLHSLSRDEALAVILQGSLIRPEDVPLYEPFVSELKLATRMHSRMRMVVAAYARGRFTGSLLDLTEPSYSPLFRGVVLDNTLVPADFGARTSACGHRCDECGYCAGVARCAAVEM